MIIKKDINKALDILAKECTWRERAIENCTDDNKKHFHQTTIESLKSAGAILWDTWVELRDLRAGKRRKDD